MERCEVIGVNINVTNMEETIKDIEKSLEENKGNYICVANVHTTVMAHEDELYKKIQNESFMSIPDGKPLSVVSKRKGYKGAKRVTGADLMKEIFILSEKKGYSHYFYGSTEETLKKISTNLLMSYPSLKILGMYSPIFGTLKKEEEDKILKILNIAGADFLWVGLGAPKQELWMYKHKNKVDSLMIGVGAGFDYFAGNIKRAPKWMRELGLEWLYRLIQDPRRLWKRYVVTNMKFIYYVIRS